MIKSVTFAKEVPSGDTELFRFTGGLALGSSLTLVIENEDATNNLIYKVQESSDGETFVDKELPTGPTTTAVSFTIGPATAHTIKLPNTSAFYRVIGRGSVRSLVGAIWYTRTNPATAASPQLLA